MNEKLEILSMIREGRISPEEGIRLLEALEKADTAPASPSPRAQRGDPKWLNIEIRVRGSSSYKSLTPIRIPFSMVRLIFRFLTGANIPSRDFDPDALLRSLESGKPLEFFAEEGGRAIRVSAE